MIINPTPIFQKSGVHEDFYILSGYVKSVTDRGSYNSVSFKVNSEDVGINAPLISVRCFEQRYGVNHKKLVANAKGRFVTILAVSSEYNGKTNYIARHIVLAPTEFCEATHPNFDEISEQVNEPEAEYEQMKMNFDIIDDADLPFLN